MFQPNLKQDLFDDDFVSGVVQDTRLSAPSDGKLRDRSVHVLSASHEDSAIRPLDRTLADGNMPQVSLRSTSVIIHLPCLFIAARLMSASCLFIKSTLIIVTLRSWMFRGSSRPIYAPPLPGGLSNEQQRIEVSISTLYPAVTANQRTSPKQKQEYSS